jgi:SPX domain protein involved in polyphosphate accumulation
MQEEMKEVAFSYCCCQLGKLGIHSDDSETLVSEIVSSISITRSTTEVPSAVASSGKSACHSDDSEMPVLRLESSSWSHDNEVRNPKFKIRSSALTNMRCRPKQQMFETLDMKIPSSALDSRFAPQP